MGNPEKQATLTTKNIAKANKYRKTGNTDHKKHSEGKQNREKQATLTTRSIAKANKTQKNRQLKVDITEKLAT